MLPRLGDQAGRHTGGALSGSVRIDVPTGGSGSTGDGGRRDLLQRRSGGDFHARGVDTSLDRTPDTLERQERAHGHGEPTHASSAACCSSIAAVWASLAVAFVLTGGGDRQAVGVMVMMGVDGLGWPACLASGTGTTGHAEASGSADSTGVAWRRFAVIAGGHGGGPRGHGARRHPAAAAATGAAAAAAWVQASPGSRSSTRWAGARAGGGSTRSRRRPGLPVTRAGRPGTPTGASGSAGAGDEPGSESTSGSAAGQARRPRSGRVRRRRPTTGWRRPAAGCRRSSRSKQYSCSWSASSIRNVPWATHGLVVPQRDEPAVVREHRVGVVDLGGGVDRRRQRVQVEPRRTGSRSPPPDEASHGIGTRALSRPLYDSGGHHRRPATRPRAIAVA